MKSYAKIIYVAWMIVSCIVLFYYKELRPLLSDELYSVVVGVAIAQLVFGLFINPIIKHYVNTRRDQLFRQAADLMLKSLVK